MDRQSLPHGEAERIIRAKAAKYCRSSPFTTSDLDDLTQEVLMHVLTAWDGYDPSQGRPDPWLARIVENKLVSIVRRAKAAKRGHGRANPQPDDQPAQERPAIDGRLDMAEVVRRLPPDLQEVVDMLRRHGSVSAAAAAEGIPRTTLRARVARLRLVLLESGAVPATWGTDGVDQR